MPRIPVYFGAAAGAAAVYYGMSEFVYEPYTTVQKAAEEALEASMFYQERFLQRAQLLAREATGGGTDRMLSLFCKCMLLREDCMDEDVLQHEALGRIIDDVIYQRCLHLDFRESALTSLQSCIAACAYSVYVVYFRMLGALLDTLSITKTSHAVAWGRRQADALVAKGLLLALQAPCELDDWRELESAVDEEAAVRYALRRAQLQRERDLKYAAADESLAAPAGDDAGRNDDDDASAVDLPGMPSFPVPPEGKKGVLIDVEAEMRERQLKEQVGAKEKLQIVEDSKMVQRAYEEMHFVEMSHEEKIEVLHRLRQSTRGIVTPTHLYIAHTTHWLEELSARAAFPRIVQKSIEKQTLSQLPPAQLAVIERPAGVEATAHRRALVDKVVDRAAEAQRAREVRRTAANCASRGGEIDAEMRALLADQEAMSEAARHEDRLIEAADRLRHLGPHARENATDFPQALREEVDRVFRFGYPWSSSAAALRDLYERFDAEVASPIAFFGVHRFVRTSFTEILEREVEAIAAERRRIEHGIKAGTEGFEGQSNLPGAAAVAPGRSAVIAERVKRRSKMVEQMRLDDESAEESLQEQERRTLTGARKEYFDEHANILLSPEEAAARLEATGGTGEPSNTVVSELKGAAAFGDSSRGAGAIVYDTPQSTLGQHTLKSRAPVAKALREALRHDDEAKAKQQAPVAAEEPEDPVAKWAVFGGESRGGRRGRRVLKVMVADPVPPEQLWTTLLRATERQHEARNADAAYGPTALGA